MRILRDLRYQAASARALDDRQLKLAVCNSSISGAVTVVRSTGPILIGDGGDATASCEGSNIGGIVRIIDASSGVEFGGNTASGLVTIIGNNVNPATVLTADDANVEIESNHLGAGLNCIHNTPAPINEGRPNAVVGQRWGQCQAL
ncbi:MAG: hypothetical protein QOF30_2147 [Acidimicrobiaceae bacterium]|nr:hypothetical protein [Acidimicrobiaceae bacterium]